MIFFKAINDIILVSRKTIPQCINPVRVTRGSANANGNVEQLLAVAHASKIIPNVDPPLTTFKIR